MRISTSTFYSSSITGIQDQQAQIAKLSQKLAERRSFLTPKEAPISASRAMALSNSVAVRNQYLANQDKAELALKYENVYINQLQSTLTSVRNSVSGIGAGQDQVVRDQLAMTVHNMYNMLKDFGNARDSEGNYIFAGHETSTLPYSHTATYPAALPGTPPFTSNPTTYAGDTGTRSIEVETGRSVQTNDDLSAVFRGNGTDAQDLLQNLDYAAAALHDSTASQSSVQAAIDNATTVLDRSLTVIRNIQTQVAGRLLEVSDLRSADQKLVSSDQVALGQLTELDMAAAIISLKQQQTSLEASQQTFALVGSLSLFNFLG
jgi:flagellar hook-associated protein 3 FlgL